MPFTSAELTQLGNVSLDAYLRNNPVDQVAVERPFLQAGTKKFNGGKQYLVEQIRTKYDSNFQFYFGAAEVTYNKRDTIRQAQWAWGSMHDGFYLDEDTLFANGISINDQMPKSASNDELVQLTDLLEENITSLRLGFEEKWSINMHQDGTQDGDAIAGLDHIVQLNPAAAGTVGGIDQAANSYWRNNFSTSIAAADLIDEMHTVYRSCLKHGGQPNLIIAGTTAIDEFRKQAAGDISRYTVLNVSGQSAQFDPAIQQGDAGIRTGLHFNQVPILWSPEFEELDTLLSPATPWEKRIYMLNIKHLRWRPARGHDMVRRTPPREYNRYVWYWALTNKGVMSTNRRNAHGLLALS